MFGYVNVNSQELRVKEFDFYKGTYCGLCKAMGKCTGQCSRMTLSYDFVFLALVRMALLNQKPEFCQKRCIAHPLKKQKNMQRNETLDFCAAAAAILNYRKVKDDISDEKGFKKLSAVLALPFVARGRKKALKHSPALSELDKKTEALLSELADTEKSTSGVDAPADKFGCLLGEIMSFGLEGSSARVLFELGRSVGAWIYIADAINDTKEDIKRGRYNPLIKLYGGRAPERRELELISLALKNHLYGAVSAFDLIDISEGEIKCIIENILYLGLPQKIEEIIKAQNKTGKGKETAND